MQQQHYHIVLNSVIACAMTLFFSCDPQDSKDQVLMNFENAPNATGKEIQLKYTDSGRLTAILKTPVILDYTNRAIGYREFPEGLVLDIIDKDCKKTVITSDYGISYTTTGIIDLQGNVDIFTGDSIHLKAPQLYWDQENSWVFTDHQYTVTFPNGSFNDGYGFDANQDFSNFNSRTNVGIQIVEE